MLQPTIRRAGTTYSTEETTAKVFIQVLVKRGEVKLYTSFVLIEEVNAGDDEEIKANILDFITAHSSGYAAKDKMAIIKESVNDIILTGVKPKDATHVACAVLAKCDYFVTTDKRLLRYENENIKLINPIDFGKIWEEQDND